MDKLNLIIITNAGNEYEVNREKSNIYELAKIITRNKNEFIYVPVIKKLGDGTIEESSILINPVNISELKGTAIEYLIIEKYNK